MDFKRLSLWYLREKLEKCQSFLLFGPRQTGKSYLLEGLFSQLPPQDQLRYYFQLPAQRERIEEDPDIIRREVEAKHSNRPLYLYIDEIQKIPQVMDVLQFLIDKKMVILAACGSSARRMRRLGTNWLPGRIHLTYLHPITWQEAGLMAAGKSPDEFLLFGSLPGVLSQQDLSAREEDLRSYTHLYLDEEIRTEAVVRNLPRFNKFLRLAALESGTAPNFSKIGSQIGASHTTVREYYQILEDTLIVHRLDAFGSARDQVLRSSKYYFFDTGVRNAAAQIGHSQGILTLQRGLLFEHFVILEMIAQLKGKADFYYWKTKSGQEVDLIIQHAGKRHLFEIKATTRPISKDFHGIDIFQKKYGCDQAWLVCQVERAQKFGSHCAIPWQELPERFAA